MSKKLYFDAQCGLEHYACTDDGKLTEYEVEKSVNGAAVGNVYKGRVTDVLNGMQAAFVDCGLERHCYISVADLMPDRTKYDGKELDIPSSLDLHVGDEILVQITKPPVGKKGAKATTNISYVGRYMVYTPYCPFIGVSAQISDAELRKNLIHTAKSYLTENEGVIVRTAAPYAVRGVKLREVEYLRQIHKGVLASFENAEVGDLLYRDSPLHMRVLRDKLLTAADEIHTGSKEIYEGLRCVQDALLSDVRPALYYHDEHTDLFFEEGIYTQFGKSLMPKVELENGTYLIIEKTEALTVIDVNTGKFTGEDSLEQTVFTTNVLAAREIARQVKLRNLGGLFVVDFIDMTDEKHCKALAEELERALKRDKARCKVLPMSKFGLIEFTRKRTGTPADTLMCKSCPTCRGAGWTRSEISILGEFRARLLHMLAAGKSTVCADLNFNICNALVADKALIENISALYPMARVYVVAHRTYAEDCMYFRAVEESTFVMPEGTILLY